MYRNEYVVYSMIYRTYLTLPEKYQIRMTKITILDQIFDPHCFVYLF